MLDLFDREVKPNLFWFDNFSDGVLKAIQQTKLGKICLLSPAAASYDEFHNFEHRGNKFRELVKSHHGK
jgi:UDP-N-acetylmuramoylalanine--D-glutamate ligase